MESRGPYMRLTLPPNVTTIFTRPTSIEIATSIHFNTYTYANTYRKYFQTLDRRRNMTFRKEIAVKSYSLAGYDIPFAHFEVEAKTYFFKLNQCV